MTKKPKSRGRSKNIPCRSEKDGSTQKLYAMVVDKFFSGYKDKNERFRILSAEEEREMIKRLKDNRPELEKELVMHNIFLAIGFASKQQYRFRDFDELISLSMYGLVDAARKFDIEKKCRFNTYAVWYLKKHVLRQFYVKKECEIANKTAIFLDEPLQKNGEENDGDFMFSSINSQIEPSVEDAYSSKNAVDYIENEEHDEYMKTILAKVVNTVSTSSLSETDKKIFNLSFINGENISTISHELGISSTEVSNGRKRVRSFINENFSKKDIFAA